MSPRPRSRLGRVTALLFAAVLLTVPGTGVADEDEDEDEHERARRGVQSGRLMPLDQALRKLKARIDGEIISIELEEEDGRPTYEIKYIDRRGRIREIHLDARRGRRRGGDD